MSDKELKRRINYYWYDEDGKIFLKVKKTLNALSKQDRYTILGYGSLLSKRSTKNTMPDAKFKGYYYLSGYVRIFNLGYEQSFLNIKRGEGKAILCTKWEVTYDDMINYIIREALYSLEKTATNEYFVINYTDAREDLEPDINYIQTCLEDIKENVIHVNNFYDYTLVPNYGTLRDFLKAVKENFEENVYPCGH